MCGSYQANDHVFFGRLQRMHIRMYVIDSSSRKRGTAAVLGFKALSVWECGSSDGQTGSGKTFTMEGPPDNRGVNFRALDELFRVKEERTNDVKYILQVRKNG